MEKKKACYMCTKEIVATNTEACRVHLDWAGGKPPKNYMRTIGQNICSLACLRDLLKSLSEDVEETRKNFEKEG